MTKELKEAFYTNDPNFKKMMKIIKDFQNSPALDFDNVEKHHIVPKAYYRKLGIQINSKKENLVRLPFNEHMTVHFYAAECARPIIKPEMLCARNNFFKLKNISEEFVLEHKNQFAKSKRVETNGWKNWAREKDPENFQRYLNRQIGKTLRQLRKVKRLIENPSYPGDAKKCVRILRRVSKNLRTLKVERQERKVICINTGEVFNSVREAGEKMGLSAPQIRTVCGHSGRHKRVQGFFFEYLENYDPDNPPRIKDGNQNRRKKVYCLETGIIYKSIAECSKKLSCNTTGIANNCNGKIHALKGYHFRWVE